MCRIASYSCSVLVVLLVATALLQGIAPAVAEDPPGHAIRQALEARFETDAALAQQIWELAEVGYQEARSSELLQAELVAALPGAVFSIWHNLSGSLLAAWWSRHETPEVSGSEGEG